MVHIKKKFFKWEKKEKLYIPISISVSVPISI